MTIGGEDPGALNVIGCSSQTLILSGVLATDLIVRDNLIGLAADGVTPAPASGSGVEIGGGERRSAGTGSAARRAA